MLHFIRVLTQFIVFMLLVWHSIKAVKNYFYNKTQLFKTLFSVFFFNKKYEVIKFIRMN